MKVVIVPYGAVGIDCLTPLTPAMLLALKTYVLPGTKTGITFVIRYLENLTATEVANILAAGFGLIVIGESRPNGYIPSAADGTADGQREAAKVNALGLPHGLTVGCDLEGMGGTAADTIAYANAWAQAVVAVGLAMAYVGAGIPLTPQQLWLLLDTLYWHSLSSVQQVAVCDYAMIQGYPTQTLDLGSGLTLEADINFCYRDKLGRAPFMVTS
jgi:hypothetical protein